MHTFVCIRLARFNLDSRARIFYMPGEISPMGQPANLEKILLEAVDEGLLVPGEIVRTAIYERLGLDFREHDGWTVVDYVNHVRRGQGT